MNSEHKRWMRQEGESSKAYDSFLYYLHMPSSERSLDAAYLLAAGQQKGTKRASGAWKRYAKKFHWTERVQAYDDHLSSLAFFTQGEAVNKAAQERLKRLELLEKEEFEIGQALLKKGKEMLAFPLATQRREQDGKTIHIHPAKWTFQTAARVLEAGDKLTRLSAGLPTDAKGMDITGLVNAITETLLETTFETLGEAAYEKVGAALMAKKDEEERKM